MSYNFDNGMPYQSPNWTQNYLAGITSLSATQPEAPPINVPFSPVSANGTLPAAAPGNPMLAGLGRIGDWMGKNGQTIGNWANVFGQGMQAYLGLKQLSLAKDALKFEKKSFKTNLANQVDSYNTQMKDRITGRYYATEEERQAALRDAELPQGMRG